MSVLTTTYSMELTSSSTTEWASLFKESKAYKPARSTGKATLFLDQIHDEILPIEYIKLKTGKLEDRIMDDSKQFDLAGQVRNSNDCLTIASKGDTIGNMISKYGILFPTANLKGSDPTNDKWRKDQQVKCNIVDCFTGTFMCPGPNNMLDSATRGAFVSFCKTMGIMNPTENTRLFSSGLPEHYFFTSQHNCDLLLFCWQNRNRWGQIPTATMNDPQKLQAFINETNFNYVWNTVIEEVEECINKDGYFEAATDVVDAAAAAATTAAVDAKLVADWKTHYIHACILLKEIQFTEIDVYNNKASWTYPGAPHSYNWCLSQPASASTMKTLSGAKLLKALGKTILNAMKFVCSGVKSRSDKDNSSTTDAGNCAKNMQDFLNTNPLNLGPNTAKGPNTEQYIKIQQAFFGLLKFLGDTSHIVFGRIIIQIKKDLHADPSQLAVSTSLPGAATLTFADRLNVIKTKLDNRGNRHTHANIKSFLDNLDVNFYVEERPLTTRLLLDSPQLLCSSIINIQYLKRLNELYTPAVINSSNYLSVTADQEMIKTQYKNMLKLAVDTFIPYTGNSSVFDLDPPNDPPEVLNLLKESDDFKKALNGLFTLLGSTDPGIDIVAAAEAAGLILNAIPSQMLTVIVPANVVSGQQFQTITPDGQTVTVTVPPGTGGGQSISVSYIPVHTHIEANYDNWAAQKVQIIKDVNEQYIIYNTVKTLWNNIETLKTSTSSNWDNNFRDYMGFGDIPQFTEKVLGTQGQSAPSVKRSARGSKPTMKMILSPLNLSSMPDGPTLLKRSEILDRFKYLVLDDVDFAIKSNAKITLTLYNDSIIVIKIINSLADIITIKTTGSTSNLAKDIVDGTDMWWKKLSIFIGFFGELFKNSYVGKDLWKGRHSSSYAIYARRPLEDFISSVGILTQGGDIPLIALSQIATVMPLAGGMRDVVNLHSIRNGQRGGALGEVLVVFRDQNKNLSPQHIAVQIDQSQLYIIAKTDTGIQPASLFLNNVRIPQDQPFSLFLEQYGYIYKDQQGWQPISKGQSKGLDWFTSEDTKGGWSEFALIIDFIPTIAGLTDDKKLEIWTQLDWRQQLQIMEYDFSTADALLEWDAIKLGQKMLCTTYQSLWDMNFLDTNQEPITKTEHTLYNYCKDPATGGRCLLLFFLREIPTSWAPTSWAGTNAKSTINTCLINAGFSQNSIIAWDWYVRLYIYIMNTTNTEFLTILKYRGITDSRDEEAWLKNYLYYNLGDSSPLNPLKEYFLGPLLTRFREVDMGQDTNLAKTPDDEFQFQLRVEEFKYILFEYILFPDIYDAPDYYRIIILSYYFDNRFYIENPDENCIDIDDYLAEAERQRLAEAERQRLAEAEAERQRLAEAERQLLAEEAWATQQAKPDPFQASLREGAKNLAVQSKRTPRSGEIDFTSHQNYKLARRYKKKTQKEDLLQKHKQTKKEELLRKRRYTRGGYVKTTKRKAKRNSKAKRKRRNKTLKKRPKTNKKRRSLKSKLRIKKRTLKKRRR